MSKVCSGVTALTLFDLVKKSMRKNVKHYYLYFFALIFSVMLYFVFATLQQDGAVIDKAGQSNTFSSAFKVAGVLLIGISSMFIIYANTLFLNRRSREIGLYQLIGLTKNAVARMLILENVLLSAGALFVGIGTGIVVSRLFLMLLVKLIGQVGVMSLSISGAAIVQTLLVFAGITVVTSIQMYAKVKRKTLLQLFNDEKAGEHPRKPKRFLSPLMAILGIALIVYGYWLSDSTRLFQGNFLINAFLVLFATIFGAYLVFRISISWLFYQIRQRKNGLLGLNNSLSIAPLMHRMKGNAKSLTVITVLSAMTLAAIAGAYSLYYSTEKEARYTMPQDFLFLHEKADAEGFVALLAEEDIDAKVVPLEYLQTKGTYENFAYTGFVDDNREGEYGFKVYNHAQLAEAQFEMDPLANEEAVYFDPYDVAAANFVKESFQVRLVTQGDVLQVDTIGTGSVVNVMDYNHSQLVVNEQTFERLQQEGLEQGAFYAVTMVDRDQLAAASELFHTLPTNINESEDYPMLPDYYSVYQEMMESNGLLIFIAGFLGLVFLISTGSILYFKQMTEAEQERKSYATLRQLGFSVQDIMKGIMRKQLFVFGLPLLIGLLHSIFAIRSVDLLFTSNITVPTVIAMSVYALIYFVFALLTVGYYRKIVKSAL